MVDSEKSCGPVRLWLGPWVVPVGFSVAVLSGPVLWPGRVRVILTRLTPATARAAAGPGLWLGGVPGPQLPTAGSGAPGPAGEPFPQRGDIGPAEPYVGESRIRHLVQPQPGIGEVAAGQAGSSRRARRISWPGA